MTRRGILRLLIAGGAGYVAAILIGAIALAI